MSLQKGFLRPSIPDDIPIYKYIVGVVIGVSFSFCVCILFLTVMMYGC